MVFSTAAPVRRPVHPDDIGLDRITDVFHIQITFSCQIGAQCGQRSLNEGFDARHGRVHGRGHFPVPHSLETVQDQGLPLPSGRRVQSRPDRLFALGLFQVARPAPAPGSPVVRPGRNGPSAECLRRRRRLRARLPAISQEPTPEHSLGPVGTGFPENLHEGVLGQVFGFLDRTQHVDQETLHFHFPPLDEEAESRLLPCAVRIMRASSSRFGGTGYRPVQVIHDMLS